MQNEIDVVEGLKRRGVFVDRSEKIIDMLGKEGPGIKGWKLIDFLCHYCGYRWTRGY